MSYAAGLGRWVGAGAAVALAAGLLAAGPVATAQVEAGRGAAVVEVNAPARAARTTTVTISAPTCEGCLVQGSQYRLDQPSAKRGWSTKRGKVKNGTVSFTVPTRRTRGLAFTVHAPWEGLTGYAAVVAVSYSGSKPGDVPTLEDVVTKQRATACWAGTGKSAVTLTMEAHEVEVDGQQERVPGTIAWFTPTPKSWGPSRRIYDGVFGTQDVLACRKP